MHCQMTGLCSEKCITVSTTVSTTNERGIVHCTLRLYCTVYCSTIVSVVCHCLKHCCVVHGCVCKSTYLCSIPFKVTLEAKSYSKTYLGLLF